jgi:hypothetical protein
MRSPAEAERFASILETASRECGGLGGRLSEPESQARGQLRNTLRHFYTFSFSSSCETEPLARLHVVTQQNARLNGCSLKWHFARTEDAHTRKDVQKELHLGLVTEVRRESLEAALQKDGVTAVAAGRRWPCSAAPSYSLVSVRAASFDGEWIGFRSSSDADAFATALKSVAKECGGLRGR